MRIAIGVIGVAVLVAIGVREYRKRGFTLVTALSASGAACFVGGLALHTFNP